MKTFLKVLLVVGILALFLPARVKAQTFPSIGHLGVGEKKVIVITGLKPGGKYGWKEVKLSPGLGNSLNRETLYEECFDGPPSGQKQYELGPYSDGPHEAQLSKGGALGCKALIVSRAFTVGSATPIPGTQGGGGNNGPSVMTCPSSGAQGIETALGCIPTENTSEFIKWVLRWAIGIAGGIAFLLILSSGFQIMTSAGSPDKLKAGQEQLTAAISGLLFVLFSVFLLKLIGLDILQIPGFGTP